VTILNQHRPCADKTIRGRRSRQNSDNQSGSHGKSATMISETHAHRPEPHMRHITYLGPIADLNHQLSTILPPLQVTVKFRPQNCLLSQTPRNIQGTRHAIWAPLHLQAFFQTKLTIRGRRRSIDRLVYLHPSRSRLIQMS